MEEHLAVRTDEKMREVLMHPDAPGPAIHYYMIRGGSKKGNITVWEAGTVGGEYIKTYGHYHVDDLPETYWFVSGTGVALLQKLAGDGSDLSSIEDFKAIPVKAGDVLNIPIRYGHLVANTGKSFLVTNDDSPVAGIGDSASMPVHADYKQVQQMRGFAYYVVEHDGKPALVKNPLYAEVLKTDFGGLAIVEA
jgi:oxalate decarboxylase/phosphoglucose isomerase-like protein (cupin superfamily)